MNPHQFPSPYEGNGRDGNPYNPGSPAKKPKPKPSPIGGGYTATAKRVGTQTIYTSHKFPNPYNINNGGGDGDTNGYGDRGTLLPKKPKGPKPSPMGKGANINKAKHIARYNSHTETHKK
jgi:hypothetical protein